MPEIYLLKNPLAPQEREHATVEPATEVIDWLVNNYPNGFEYPIRVYINQREIAIANLDTPLHDNDVCHILVMPADGGTISIPTIIINALIAAAIGLVLNLLFPPPKRKGNNGAPNPVYDINASRNQARLGEPVPVAFGNPLMVPDLAQAPYTFYSKTSSNDMYVDHLLCVGHGEFEEITLDDIRLGSTPARDMPAGTIRFRQFHQGPAVGNIESHRGTINQIEQALWADRFGGDSEWKFMEMPYTAPEVTDWEFNDDVNTQTASFPNTVMDFTAPAQPGGPGTIRMPSSVDVKSGASIKISGTAAHDGTYVIGFVYPDMSGTADGEGIQDFNILTILPGSPTLVTTTATGVNGTVQGDITYSNAIAGPYVVCPPTRTVSRIYIDLEAPRGIYRARTNGRYEYTDDTRTPLVTITATEIDDAGVVVPGGVVARRTYTMNGNRPDPLRRTVEIRPSDVQAPHAAADFQNKRYQVVVQATYNLSDSSKISNTINWTALRSEIWRQPGARTYGNTTLLAIRMKATNGVSDQAQDQIKVKARRKYRLADGTYGPSANPADVMYAIYSDKEFSIGRPDADMDMTQILACRGLWEMNFDKPEFHGVYLDRSTVWECLEQAVGVAVARPALEAGALTLVRDSLKPVNQWVFNDANIVDGSMSVIYSFDSEGDFAGMELEYRDPQTFNPEYVYWPSSNAGDNLQKHELFGCTDEAYAAKYVRLLWNRHIYQRIGCTFQVEMEGMLPTIGDRCLVAHKSVRWGISGNVMEVRDAAGTNPILVLDNAISWDGSLRWICISGEPGQPSDWIPITQGPEDHVVVLDSNPAIDLDMSHTQELPRYTINALTGAGRSMTITRIEHAGGVLFNVECRLYATTFLGHPMFGGAPDHLRRDLQGNPL